MLRVLMCEPTNFQVTYEINPWMHIGSVDPEAAMRQWQELVAVYQQLGVKVEVIQQREGLSDMVFAVDQGVVHGRKFLQAHFRHPQRQGETPVYQEWLEANGYVIHRLDAGLNFEGGDIRAVDDRVFVGCGYRTSCAAAAEIGKFLEADVVSLDLIDRKFYHLDTCLFPVNETAAFLYTPAFAPASLTRLRKHFLALIEISEAEANNFAANGVSINQDVLVQAHSPRMTQAARELGLEVIEVDVSEFMKAGGGINCLTLNLNY